ncbi:MAG: hypothetical protein ACTSVZ_02875, partial [Promethearchaeota archaeon]
DLPVILLNNSSVIPLLKEILSESVDRLSFDTKLACFSLFLINKINNNSDLKQKLTYMHKSITSKGCINGYHPQLLSLKRNSSQFLKYAQHQSLAHFLPLLGLNPRVFGEMEKNLMNPHEALITTEFSLTSLIIQDFDSTKAPNTSLNKKISGNEVSQQILDPKREMELLDQLNQVFESPRFSSIVDLILNNAEIVRIKGKKI